MLELYTALLVGIAFIARLGQGAWTAPGPFFCLIWIIASAPAVAFVPDYVSPTVMLLIASFAAAVVAGSQLTVDPRRLGHDSVRPSEPQGHLPRVLLGATCFLAACGFLACIGYVREAGYGLLELSSARTWLDLAVHYSSARYHQDYVEPLAIRVLLAANYAGAIVCGMLLSVCSRRIARIVGSLPIIAAALITILTTAKTPLLLSGVFTLSSWLAQHVAAGLARRNPVAIGRWLTIGATAFCIGLIGLVSLLLRYGVAETSATFVVDRVGGYLVGHMVALSAWISVENWSTLDPTWGSFTFAGAYEFLGLSRREAGLYNIIGLNTWSAQSNVFSALRGAIIDFGIFGAWGTAALMGALSGHAYTRLRLRARGAILSRVGLTVFYAFACWSPIVSILAYNVVLLAIVVAMIVLVLASGEIDVPPLQEPRRAYAGHRS